MNILPELPGFLKFGILGFASIVLVLLYLLLSKEQSKKQPNKSIITSIYAFMVLGFLLFVFGLIAPRYKTGQQSVNTFEKSSGNKVRVTQKGDTARQSSENTFVDSDSNDVNVEQVGAKDTVKVN